MQLSSEWINYIGMESALLLIKLNENLTNLCLSL